MTPEQFEAILDDVCASLTDAAQHRIFPNSKTFENAVRSTLEDLGKAHAISVDFDPHPHVFPDIAVESFGVEVKFSDKDTWRSIANSVFEGRRNAAVKTIYLLFGKMGGTPQVRWGHYEHSVIHVRTSHVPRFEVELSDKPSLFDQFGLSYAAFQVLTDHEKMEHIRAYARGRLEPGQRLWWLETGLDDSEHTLQPAARLYTSLSQTEKYKLRAEAALLSPKVVQPNGTKGKYDDVALYILTSHGVLCTQVRDLFSAGSVALASDQTRGGNYVERALKPLEAGMRAAAGYLSDELFVEYWGEAVRKKDRIEEWLTRADFYAGKAWRPSDTLFVES